MAYPLHDPRIMPNTSEPFATIDTDRLDDVNGGSKRRHSSTTTIINNYTAAPAPAAPAPSGGGWSVDVSAGYAQA